MFAAAVDAAIGLFVEQDGKVMLAGNAFHQVHDQLVVVVGQVDVLEDRCQFELVGRHFVVTGLDGDAQFVAFDLQLLHEGCDTRRDGAEIVVFELLVLGRGVSHQRTARQTEVGAGIVKGQVDEEVFLFPAEVGVYAVDVLVEQLADVGCCLVHGVQGFQQRGLVVQGLAGIGDEDGGDTEGGIYHEGR